MPRKRILITVKTYPVLSTKYRELVCTAGFLEDGSWIRIYPVPFRRLDLERKYEKYNWVSVDIEKSEADKRPESYKVKNLDTLQVVGQIPPDKSGVWETRRKLVLRNVHTSKKAIIAGVRSNKLSLVVFKPKQFIDFYYEPDTRNWDPRKIALLKADQKQLNIFEGLENAFSVVKKVPYKFFYTFEDEDGVPSTLMVEDWELGALYWNCFQRYRDEKRACELVKKKYWDEFVVKRDNYLFLGTTKAFHFKNVPNPFLVVGVFSPKPKFQEELF